VKRRGDKGFAVLGAENNVGEQVGEGVRHVLSPLRGLGGILLDSFTHRLRSGLRPFARYAGCDVEWVTRKGLGWRRAQLCGPQTRLISGEPIILKKLGAAAGQGVEPSSRKIPFVGGYNQR
jgi:hypothetical protein